LDVRGGYVVELGMEYPQQTKIHRMLELMYRELQKAYDTTAPNSSPSPSLSPQPSAARWI
jgi:hypothetical protein